MTAAEPYVPEVLEAYGLQGPALRYGCGHINDTFLATRENVILQRVSLNAFPHPEQVMANLLAVTDFLAARIRANGGDPNREALQIRRCLDGSPFYKDSAGATWRAFPCIQYVRCYQTAETPEIFAAAEEAFGRFTLLLNGYPVDTLYETIPRFHDTPYRLQQLRDAIAADSAGRAASVQPEIAFALQREADCAVAMDAQRKGILPLRACHYDTKLNNVLLDEKTGKGVCVIDLDTVMPGLSIFDFGDAIRFGANHCAEDERDLSQVSLDLDLYRIYAKAFLRGTHGILTQAEVSYLPWGARLMTLECGIRFLADYLNGDIYFHTQRPDQNLDRCRTQFKLVSDMEAHWAEMQSAVR